eukprot:jgi/Mesvir1/28936/Mv17721-RA.1
MQTIWIARHGDREDFADPRWPLTAERPDDPGLSADGIVQASDLGRRLLSENISHIYASPFLRTVQTAHIVAEALQLPVKIETGLTEYMCPDYFCAMPVLLTPASLKARFPRLDLSYGAKVPFSYPEYGMEAAERAGRAARMLADAHAGENLLLVGHGASVIWATQGLMGRGAGSVVRPWLCCLVKLVRQPAMVPPALPASASGDANGAVVARGDAELGGGGAALAKGHSECGCWCMELAGDVSHLSERAPCRKGLHKHRNGVANQGRDADGRCAGGSGADPGDDERWVESGCSSTCAGAAVVANGNSSSPAHSRGWHDNSHEHKPNNKHLSHPHLVMCIECNGGSGGVQCDGLLVQRAWRLSCETWLSRGGTCNAGEWGMMLEGCNWVVDVCQLSLMNVGLLAMLESLELICPVQRRTDPAFEGVSLYDQLVSAYERAVKVTDPRKSRVVMRSTGSGQEESEEEADVEYGRDQVVEGHPLILESQQPEARGKLREVSETMCSMTQELQARLNGQAGENSRTRGTCLRITFWAVLVLASFVGLALALASAMVPGMASAVASVAELKVEILLSQAHAAELERQLQEARGQLDQASKNLRSLAEQLDTSQAKAAELATALQTSQHHAAELERQLQEARGQLDQASKNLRSLAEQLHTSQDKAAELATALQTSQHQAAELEQELHASQAKGAELEKALQTSEAKNAELGKEVQRFQAAAAELERQKAHLPQEVKDALNTALLKTSANGNLEDVKGLVAVGADPKAKNDASSSTEAKVTIEDMLETQQPLLPAA